MGRNQESVTISPYPLFVVKRLVGTFGNSKSSVIDYILKDWISKNYRIVEEADAGMKVFLASQSKDE